MADPKRPVLWSRDALTDLAAIWRYYAEAARPQTADGIIRDIEKMCRLLEDHPLAGRARDEVRPGLRSIAARPISFSTASQMMLPKSFVYWTGAEILKKSLPPNPAGRTAAHAAE
jgi:plasmid stabilization system protein ParE